MELRAGRASFSELSEILRKEKSPSPEISFEDPRMIRLSLSRVLLPVASDDDRFCFRFADDEWTQVANSIPKHKLSLSLLALEDILK